MIDRKVVKLVELVVLWDTTYKRKNKCYQDLDTEIQGNGFKYYNISLEIWTNGQLKEQNHPHTAVT